MRTLWATGDKPQSHWWRMGISQKKVARFVCLASIKYVRKCNGYKISFPFRELYKIIQEINWYILVLIDIFYNDKFECALIFTISSHKTSKHRVWESQNLLRFYRSWASSSSIKILHFASKKPKWRHTLVILSRMHT